MPLFGPKPLPSRPIFVGGTGRSGTSVVGRVLGAHPDAVALPCELRVHADNGGVWDLVDERVTWERFLERTTGEWFHRSSGSRRERGLHLLVSREQLDAAIARFDRKRRRRPNRATRQFIEALVADTVGDTPAWVETTPYTMRAAPRLREAFPEARFLHLVRDGRDVAASAARRPWGPEDPHAGLAWWATRLRQADKGAQAAASHVLRVDFETLALTDRAATYDQMLAYVGLDPDDQTRAAFDRLLTHDKANVGRWRHDLPADEWPRFEARYRELFDELAAEGVANLPLPAEQVDEIVA